MPGEKITFENEAEYQSARQKVNDWKKKGETKLSDKKINKLRLLEAAIQEYKKESYTIAAPETLEELIRLKMYERKMKQKELAALLGLEESKVSQIMRGKRRADVAFLKAAHEQLGIDGNVLLKYM